MRSPLDLIKGDFEHAIFATYTCNLAFFERWVIPLLGQARVRNVVVIADSEQLGSALSDRHVQLAGRLYHVHGIRAPGFFHPKLMLLTSREHARLCVSSANLTVSGQLRNLESAAAFDSNLAGHGGVIASAAAYFRRLAADAPAHIAGAIFDGIASTDYSEEKAVARFVHNLDSPLIERFDRGAISAIAPFADTTAASRIASQAELTYLADGAQFAAGEGFFEGKWTVDARRFERRLHGKAFWRADGSWALVGSPNLTEPALLQTSNAGNFETGVEFVDLTGGFPSPPSSPWDGDAIDQVAPRRIRKRSVAEATTRTVIAFSAWEEDDHIATADLHEGTEVEYATPAGWRALGTVEESKIAVDGAVRPQLLRAMINGRAALAVVHRVTELRARARRRPQTSTARVLSGTLPLEADGQRALELVLGDLLALASLVRDQETDVPPTGAPKSPRVEPAERLTAWLPANPEDEPRIPDIYHRAWAERRPVDVLLALARTALRIDDIDGFTPGYAFEEISVSEELRDLDDLDQATEAPTKEDTVDDVSISTTHAILARYRSAFLRRLDEVVRFIGVTENQDLADLALQVTLQQHERLGIEVVVDDEPTPLVEPEALLAQKFAAISAYLKTSGDDPLCMETIRYHFAKCLEEESVWTPLEREKLEQLAFLHGRRVLETPLPQRQLESLMGLERAGAEEWIRAYVDRTEWVAIAKRAEEYLWDSSLSVDPFPHIVGHCEFTEISHAPGRGGSPAWDVVGYGSIAGLADDRPFGIGVWNSGDEGYYLAHVLCVAPLESRLYEAVLRRSDRVWLWRYYQPIGRQSLEDAAKFGPTVLGDAFRSPFTDSAIANLPQTLRFTVALLPGEVET